MRSLTVQPFADNVGNMSHFSLHLVPILSDNYVYVLRDEAKQKTLIVDPGAAVPVAEFLAKRSWSLDTILLTHHHSDHIDGCQGLRATTGCEVWGSALDQARLPSLDRTLQHRETLHWTAQITIQVLHVPGHTLGHMAYHLPECQILFCGDTLFSSGCGRLFEGSAQQMWNSLQMLRGLPATTKVCCAHEYSKKNVEFAQTLLPLDADLLARAQAIADMSKLGQPTIPTQLELERKINLFLRADDPEVKAALGLSEECAADQVFAVLRKKRDHF